MYKPSVDWTDRANKRAGYMDKLDEMTSKKKKPRWCKNHPTSFWGENYNQCVQGYKANEACIEGGDKNE